MTPPTPAMTAQEALVAELKAAYAREDRYAEDNRLLRDKLVSEREEHDVALSDAERRATEAGTERDEWKETAANAQRRRSAVEARCERMREALEEIAKHPAELKTERRSYGIGWAFHNVQGIARSILAYPGGKSEEPTERAQIVAWLRGHASVCVGTLRGVMVSYADAIERGEHLPGGKSDQGEKEKPVPSLHSPHPFYAESPAGGEGKPEPVAWRKKIDGEYGLWGWLVENGKKRPGEKWEPLYAVPLSRSGDSALVEARRLLTELGGQLTDDDLTTELWERIDDWLAANPEDQQHGERK